MARMRPEIVSVKSYAKPRAITVRDTKPKMYVKDIKTTYQPVISSIEKVS